MLDIETKSEIQINIDILTTLRDNLDSRTYVKYLVGYKYLVLAMESDFIDLNIDLAYLDNKLLDTLASDEIHSSEFPIHYSRILGNYMYDILDMLGITIETERYDVILSCFYSIVILPYLSTSCLNVIYSILSNGSEDNITVYSSYVNYLITDSIEGEYSSTFTDDIVSVTDRIIDSIRRYCSSKIERESAYEDKNVYLITRIDKIPSDLLVKDLFKAFFKYLDEDKFVYEYHELYKVFDIYYNNHVRGKLDEDEIAKCILNCYLASDTKDSIEECLNLTNLDLLGRDELSIHAIRRRVLELYSRIIN